jgi:hypothetical protein
LAKRERWTVRLIKRSLGALPFSRDDWLIECTFAWLRGRPMPRHVGDAHIRLASHLSLT